MKIRLLPSGRRQKLQNAMIIAQSASSQMQPNANIPRRKTEREIGDVLREDQFGFRRGKGTRDARDAIWKPRIIPESTLDIDKELCACFIHWQKTLDHVNRTKLMQILKGIGINWCKRRLIRKLYMDQSVKLRLDQGETRSVKIGRGVRQGCGCHHFYSTCTANILPRKLLKVLESAK
jgi:hypothetical protein